MAESRIKRIGIAAACVGLTAGIFALDGVTPLGFSCWLLYLIPILLSLMARRRAWPFFFAALSSVLTATGLFVPPPGAPFAFAAAARAVGGIMFWTTAVAADAAFGGRSESGTGSVQTRLTFSSFVSVGALIILLIAVTYQITAQQRETERFVAHTHEVLTELALTRSTLIDAETGQRGFLLTDNETYLEPYTRALAEIRRHLDRLKRLTQDNQIQQGRLLPLDAATDEKLAELHDTIVARRNQRPDEARRIVKTGQGKAVMDSIRRMLAEMEQTEQDLLARRSHASESLFHSQILLLIMNGLVLTGLLTATTLFLHRAQVVQQEQSRFFTVSRDLACIWGTDGYFKRLNPAWTRVLGYAVEELLAKPWLHFVHPDDRNTTVQQTHRQIAEQRGVTTFENRYRCKDGSYRWLSWTATPPLEQGIVYATAHDITARKETEAALRESEEHLRLALNASTMGICQADPATGQLLQVNRGICTILGYDEQELLGRPFSDFTHPEDRQRNLEGFASLTRGDIGEYRAEKRYIRKDGHIVWGHVTVNMTRNDQGRPLHTIAIVHDITERKRSEAQRDELALRLLEVQENERRAVARDLHDEVGQSLTALMLNLQRAARTTADLPAWLGDSLALTDLVLRQVRNLSRTLHPSALDDLGLSAAIKGWTDQQAQLAEVAIETKIDPSLAGLPRLLETACYRIVQEAVTNAIRHARCRTIRVSLARHAANLELLIQDDGIGFVVGAAPPTSSHATGIGLTSMQERARLLGGAVQMISVPGQGTLVRAILPLSPEPAQARATQEEATP